MKNEILNVLAHSTPALRARYLNRIQQVPGPEARQLEAELRQLIAQDQRAA